MIEDEKFEGLTSSLLGREDASSTGSNETYQWHVNYFASFQWRECTNGGQSYLEESEEEK